VSGQQDVSAAVYPRERPGTHFAGGWVGPRADLDGRKISSPRGFDATQMLVLIIFAKGKRFGLVVKPLKIEGYAVIW